MANIALGSEEFLRNPYLSLCSRESERERERYVGRKQLYSSQIEPLLCYEVSLFFKLQRSELGHGLIVTGHGMPI